MCILFNNTLNSFAPAKKNDSEFDETFTTSWGLYPENVHTIFL